MSLMDDFRADAVSRLQVTAGTPVPHTTPPQINVGEAFSVTFKIKNTDTHLTYKNVRLVIQSTRYAIPVPMFEVPVLLGPSTEHSHTFVFTAQDAADYYKLLPNGDLLFVQVSEPYAKVTVHADVEITNLTKTEVFRADIRAAVGVQHS